MLERSGAHGLRAGDRFVYDIDGRCGRADGFSSDGDAYVCWDGGTYDVIKWNHMSRDPKAATETLADHGAAMVDAGIKPMSPWEFLASMKSLNAKVTPEMAVLLAEQTGVSSAFWLNMQAAFDYGECHWPGSKT